MKLLYCLLFLCFITFSMSEDPRCSQPIASGVCFGNIEKFGYDIDEHKCVQFVYGGCFGNDNQFDSLEECQAVCP
ncbi:trypsin inhibitor [Manduca sexta]|uniref:trypsin inhibitor n=1 Tax=Manduca sexta TaxID=7130 RepID=UPI00188EAA69|nr:trypsin inhibitor [Manduca sexta]